MQAQSTIARAASPTAFLAVVEAPSPTLRRLSAEVARLADTQTGRAFRRLIQTVACRSIGRASASAVRLVECSIGFLAKGASVCRNTARLAMRLFHAIAPAHEVEERDAERAGWRLRELREGHVRGPLRVISADAVEACASFADQWHDLPEVFPEWKHLTCAELTARGFRPVQARGRRKVRCPFHADGDPSLVLLASKTERACGPAYCHGGCGSVFWTLADDGSTWAREARGRAPRSPIVSYRESTLSSVIPETAMKRPPRVVVGRDGDVLRGPEVVDAIGRCESHVSARKDAIGMRRAWCADPLSALVAADRCGVVAADTAYRAGARVQRGDVEAADVLPDRFLSVGAMRPTELRLRAIPGACADSGLALASPTAMEPGSIQWVLVDIDDLDAQAVWDRRGVVERVRTATARLNACSGRFAVVETSETGVQVWIELRQRVDAVGWWRTAQARSMYAEASVGVLEAVRASGRTGGHVDQSAASPGRYGRRPGWRLVDGWIPFRVRLLGVG